MQLLRPQTTTKPAIKDTQPRKFHANLRVAVRKITTNDGEVGINYTLILNEKAQKEIGYTEKNTINLHLTGDILSISLGDGVLASQISFGRVMLNVSQEDIMYILEMANIEPPQEDYYLLIGDSFQHEGITHYTLVREGDSNGKSKK